MKKISLIDLFYLLDFDQNINLKHDSIIMLVSAPLGFFTNN